MPFVICRISTACRHFKILYTQIFEVFQESLSSKCSPLPTALFRVAPSCKSTDQLCVYWVISPVFQPHTHLRDLLPTCQNATSDTIATFDQYNPPNMSFSRGFSFELDLTFQVKWSATTHQGKVSLESGASFRLRPQSTFPITVQLRPAKVPTATSFRPLGACCFPSVPPCWICWLSGKPSKSVKKVQRNRWGSRENFTQGENPTIITTHLEGPLFSFDETHTQNIRNQLAWSFVILPSHMSRFSFMHETLFMG